MRSWSLRGSALVAALLVVSILFLSGLGFLSQRRAQYEAARNAGLSSAARAIAEAGLEDAKIKLQMDWDYPSLAGEGQPSSSYIEMLEDSSGTVVGSYEVSVGLQAYREPFLVLVIRSTGRVGDMADPEAVRTLEMEVDMDPRRSTYFTVVNWRDLGAL
jgi:hypothetical protein